MSDMKKLTRKVSFRVSEKMGEWMDAVGADEVREAIRARMEPVKEDRERASLMEPVKTEAPVPGWRARLEQQLAEKAAHEAYDEQGEPVASVPVAQVTPAHRYAPMRGRTEAEKAAALARVGGLKLMPQMKKTEFYPDEEPNEENT